ncbi:MAG: AMIN domain-containing protein [Firmicutes bacterium]|nr:AMIN domain-containing protein [Bacillota bacterium]
MKKAAAVLFFLILIIFSRSANASLKLYIGDREVSFRDPLVMINGNIMIPIDLLEEYLGAEISWERSLSEISLGFPCQTILMRLGEESAQVNEQEFRLDVAPQKVDGIIMVPLRFIANRRRLDLVFVPELAGLRLEGPGLDPLAAGEQFFLGQEVPSETEEEQGLIDIIYMGGPRSRVFIDLVSYTGYQTNLLVNPDRLVIDLFGVSGDGLPPMEINDTIVQGIRTSRFDQHTLRIVCDLNNSTGYRISPWPEGGLEVEFNYQLTALGLEESDQDAELWFEITAQPPIEIIHLENPLRLVLDLQNTTLIGKPFEIPVEHERVRRLRVSQHQPDITRIVLELQDPMSPLPVSDQGGRFVLPLFPGTPGQAQSYLTNLLAAESTYLTEQADLSEEIKGSLRGITIAVDPGHGGSDPGAIGYDGTFEKDVALAISLFLGDLLQQAGAEVVYTRDEDVYVSIFERPEIALAAGADILVSVHANSHLKRGTARGTETLYRANDQISQALARKVQDELVRAITLIDRRIWPRDDLAVFNGSEIPSVLVEVGFLDHPEEEILLRAKGFQKIAAEGIFKGIERFFREE